MDIQEIRSELAIKVKRIAPIGNKLKFIIDGQIMVIDGSQQENTLGDKDEPAACTVTMSKETYLKLQQKKINPMMAALMGKIKVEGDLVLAAKLKELM